MALCYSDIHFQNRPLLPAFHSFSEKCVRFLYVRVYVFYFNDFFFEDFLEFPQPFEAQHYKH